MLKLFSVPVTTVLEDLYLLLVYNPVSNVLELFGDFSFFFRM